jgi:hypothetical protein
MQEAGGRRQEAGGRRQETEKTRPGSRPFGFHPDVSITAASASERWQRRGCPPPLVAIMGATSYGEVSP